MALNAAVLGTCGIYIIKQGQVVTKKSQGIFFLLEGISFHKHLVSREGQRGVAG